MNECEKVPIGGEEERERVETSLCICGVKLARAQASVVHYRRIQVHSLVSQVHLQIRSRLRESEPRNQRDSRPNGTDVRGTEKREDRASGNRVYVVGVKSASFATAGCIVAENVSRRTGRQ